MEVFTSYFGNHKKFPKNAVLISIAGKSPEGFYPEYELKMLAPSWSISSEYRETGDKDLYTKRYKKEILSKLDPNEIYGIISNVAYTVGASRVFLLCYEKPDAFCHRHLVADWLEPVIHVEEYTGD